MTKEQLEARLQELMENLQKLTEQQLMVRGAVAETRRLLALVESSATETNDRDSDKRSKG